MNSATKVGPFSFPGRSASGPLLVRWGSAAWIVGAVQFFATHVIVELAWPRPYSWARNNINDLGNVRCGSWGDDGRQVCSPLHAWMNAAFVLQGALVLVGLTLTRAAWGTARSRTACALLYAAVLGWTTVVLVPADVNENLHVLGAVAIFFGGNTGLILMGIRPRGAGLRGLAAASALIGVAGLTAAVLFLNRQYLGLGMGGMERVAGLTLQAWTLLAGCFLLAAAGGERRWREIRQVRTDGDLDDRAHVRGAPGGVEV